MIKLITGDSLELLSSFAAGNFDVTMTSPIYNLGVKYRSGVADNGSRADYLRWSRLWLGQVLRVTSDCGSLFLNVAGKPTDPWGPFEVLFEARAAGWQLQNTLYWIKSMSEDDGPCSGHVKPLNSPRFVNDAVEHVFHLTKTGDVPIDRLAVGVPFADQSNLTRGGRGKNGNLRCRGNAWQISYRTIKSRADDRPHPATYPVELAEMCFKLHGLSRIGLTLDPFSGLGSTARAAKRLGLSHVGIELSAEDTADAQRLVDEEVVR